MKDEKSFVIISHLLSSENATVREIYPVFLQKFAHWNHPPELTL